MKIGIGIPIRAILECAVICLLPQQNPSLVMEYVDRLRMAKSLALRVLQQNDRVVHMVRLAHTFLKCKNIMN